MRQEETEQLRGLLRSFQSEVTALDLSLPALHPDEWRTAPPESVTPAAPFGPDIADAVEKIVAGAGGPPSSQVRPPPAKTDAAGSAAPPQGDAVESSSLRLKEQLWIFVVLATTALIVIAIHFLW